MQTRSFAYGRSVTRYSWDLHAFLRAGGRLHELLDAFGDNYAPRVRVRRPPSARPPVSAFAKLR
jgi:hypothetical protein